MDPLTVALGGAGVQLLGQHLTNNANIGMQRETNSQNLGIAREQMAFQTAESDKAWNRELNAANTSHQREVADLKAAGLNPVLSATGGSGASSPSVSAPTGSAPHMESSRIEMPDLFSFGMSAIQAEQAARKLAIDEKNSNALIAKTLDDRQLTKMKTKLAQKGMPRATLEGKANEWLSKAFDWLSKSGRKQQSPSLKKNNGKQPTKNRLDDFIDTGGFDAHPYLP